MKRVCAWCDQEMGTVENSTHPDSEKSHGICGACYDNLEFQKGVPLLQYLDSLSVPVLVVDGYAVVKAVNRKACEVLGKEPREMVQHLSGNVFECAHARLPEGCGRTIHCSGCAIRRSVTKTFETGKPERMVPATLNRGRRGQVMQIALAITTVKTGAVVLLRLDAMGQQSS